MNPAGVREIIEGDQSSAEINAKKRDSVICGRNHLRLT